MKAYRHACGWLFAQAKPVWWKPLPIEIEVSYRSNKNSIGYRARDTGNAISALKACIDGMVDAGIIPSDSATWLRWGRFELKTTVEKDFRDGVFMTVRPQ